MEANDNPQDSAIHTAAVPSGGSHRFLDEITERFAKKFHAERAALYLYDEATDTVAMRAATGFPMFGQATVVMRLGEGLCGRVIAERRPIYTETASQMRGYVAHPNFPDGDTQTFLGLPLLRGRERIGALALWRRTGIPFLAEEISEARLEADRCSPSIETAGAMLLGAAASENASGVGAAAAGSGARDLAADARTRVAAGETVEFRGEAISNGLAMGPLRLARFRALPDLAQAGSLPPAVRSFDEAVEILEAQLRALATELDKRLPEAASMLLDADMMMLHDENFGGRIRELSLAGGVPLQQAIVQVASEFMALFQASKSDYLQEKARDVEDLALRLIDAAAESDPGGAEDRRTADIVVAERVLPSDVLRVARDRAAGLVLCSGAATAHVALLVRSLRIPALVVNSRAPLSLPDGVEAVLDCASASLVVRPGEELRRRVLNRHHDEAGERRAALAGPERGTTLDGTRIQLEANVNILADLDSAVDARAAGVGLYRTEFPFLMRTSLPGEAEQLSIYSRVLAKMPGRPVTFRTLDAGGDKVLPYLERTHEDNPALGLRGIRFSLRYRDIFEQQLRAILRAIQNSGRDDISVMFPMVSSAEEFRAARERLEACLSSLHAEIGDKELHEPFVGTMIEVPATLGCLDALAEESDFFSIGTNDLIQYLLACDRTDAAVSNCWIPHHPTVLKALKLIADAAAAHSIPCAVCGEMGRDPRYLPFLVGIGIRTISLEPSQIPKNRELLSRLSVPQCEEYAAKLLSFSRVQDVENAIDDFVRTTF